jgi:hypothetical protein
MFAWYLCHTKFNPYLSNNLRANGETRTSAASVHPEGFQFSSDHSANYDNKGKGVPVLNQLSTTPGRHVGEWMYRHDFLTSTLVGGEWSVSRHGRFNLAESSTGTH